MAIQRRIASLEDAPEGLAAYYVQDGDGFSLDVDGPGQDDVDKLKSALANERDAHKTTKSRFSGVDISAEDLQTLRDRADDLAFQLENAPKARDPQELEDRAELLAARKTRELDRELQTLREQNSSYVDAIKLHEAAANQRMLRDAAMDAISGEKGIKLVDSAREDLIPFVERSFHLNDLGEIVSKEGVGLEPGLTIREALTEMQASGRRSHWFAQSTGANASGSKGGSSAGGPNPFAKDTFNMTEIGKLIRSDPARAKALAKAAGESPAKFGLGN
jgi:hypothetical protein